MKLKITLFVAMLLVTGSLFSTPTFTAFAGRNKCQTYITVCLTGSSWGNSHIWNIQPVGSTAPPNWFAFFQCFSYSITPSVTTTYNITVVDYLNGNATTVQQITIVPPCSVRKIDFTFNPPAGRLIAAPSEPAYDYAWPDLQVKWMLEELDADGQPLYAIDDPSCWAAASVPGAWNAFDGFLATNAYSGIVTEIPCSTEQGLFAESGTYRVTRYTRYPDTEWEGYSIISGPGYDPEKSGTSIAPDELPPLLNTSLSPGQLVKLETRTDNGTLEIYAVSGQLIESVRLESGNYNYELNVAGYPKGMYIVHLESDAGMATERFTVE
jgi:hypothetical protein